MKKLNPRLKSVLGYLIALVIFAIIAWRLYPEWPRVKALLAGANLALVAMHVLFQLVAVVLFIVVWHVAAVGVGCRVRPTVSAFIWLVSNLGKYVPGKVLMVGGRVEMLHRQTGRRRAECFMAFIVEHIGLCFAAVPFFILAVLSIGDIDVSKGLLPVLLVTMGGLIVLLNPRILRFGLNLALKVLKREGSELSVSRPAVLSAVVVAAASWLCYGVSGVFLLSAIGLGDVTPIGITITAFVASWLIGFLSFITPAGAGVREGIIVAFLAPHTSVAEALTIALVARFTWTGVELAGVLVGFALRSRARAGETGLQARRPDDQN